jgi:hypothetical protein
MEYGDTSLQSVIARHKEVNGLPGKFSPFATPDDGERSGR